MKKRSMLLAAVLTGTMMGTLVSGSVMAEEESYTIGISQFAEHGSLDNCREGFLEGLKEAGIEEGVNLEVILRTPSLTQARPVRFPTASFPRAWI